MTRQYCIVWMICGTAFLVRSLMLSVQHESLSIDVDAYLEIARNVASGEGFSKDIPPHSTAYRPPLFPLLLSSIFFTGAPIWLLGELHVVLGTLTCVLVIRIGTLLKLGTASFLAAAIVACDPILVQYTTLAMTETLCAFLVALWLWIRIEHPGADTQGKLYPQNAFSEGLVLGLLCLCRPAFLLGSALLQMLDLVMSVIERSESAQQATRPWGRAVRRLGWCLLGISLVVLPWTIRNGIVLGKWTPATTHGGYTFLLANNSVFYQEVLQKPWGTTWQGDSLMKWQRTLEVELAATGIPISDEVTRDRWMYARARTEIQSQPQLFLQSCLFRSLRFWDLAPWGRLNGPAGFLVWAIAFFYGLVLVGVLAGVTTLERREWKVWGAVVLLVLSLWFTHWFYWTDMRMRAPVIPILALISARGWFRLLRLPAQRISD